MSCNFGVNVLALKKSQSCNTAGSFENPALCFSRFKLSTQVVSILTFPLLNYHSNRVSTFSIGKSSPKGPFSIAMLVYQSVTEPSLPFLYMFTCHCCTNVHPIHLIRRSFAKRGCILNQATSMRRSNTKRWPMPVMVLTSLGAGVGLRTSQPSPLTRQEVRVHWSMLQTLLFL